MLEHKHVVVRAEVKNPPMCATFIKSWLANMIESIGMKLAVGLEANPISYFCNLPGNEGITGAAILETSHCSIHSWHEDGVLQFDLYTCSPLDLEVVFQQFEQFEPVKIEYAFFDRENELTLVEKSKR